jgi:hypothetical protein
MTPNLHVRRARRPLACIAAGLAALVMVPSAAASAGGPQFAAWTVVGKIDDIAGNDADLNTGSADGCPIQSPDGLSLFLASNRPGGKGGLDIWMATREHTNDAWGAPVNLPEPINSASNDFCPTPLEGGSLLFVSNRVVEGVTCGMGDIYVARRNPSRDWGDPEHLPCAPNGPNSPLDEQGPSYAQGRLYFSSSSPTVPGDLFVSTKAGDSFGPASPIVELNDRGANDIQPNVRKDGRELVFSSNRTGGAGGQDIWTATRASVADAWSTPVNVSSVNTTLGETRPSLSSDAEQLLFGRAGPAGTGEGGSGASDIYVATRSKNP